ADRTHFPLPVLILLDLHVPGRSGLELLTWLRQQPNLDRIPVVMLSGSSESEDIDRAFELGANSYLVKPVAFDTLLDTVTGLGLPWMILGGDGKGRDG
ncbi:MAG: response regulator, partial [Actinobacteria bacterium]